MGLWDSCSRFPRLPVYMLFIQRAHRRCYIGKRRRRLKHRSFQISEFSLSCIPEVQDVSSRNLFLWSFTGHILKSVLFLCKPVSAPWSKLWITLDKHGIERFATFVFQKNAGDTVVPFIVYSNYIVNYLLYTNDYTCKFYYILHLYIYIYIYIYILYTHIDKPAYGSQTMRGSAIFRVAPCFQANIQRSRKLVGQIARSAAGDRRRIWSYMVQYLHFRILNFPLIYGYLSKLMTQVSINHLSIYIIYIYIYLLGYPILTHIHIMRI